MNAWDFGATRQGFRVCWYTPEGFARVLAEADEAHDGCGCGAPPVVTLANTILNTALVRCSVTTEQAA